MDILKGRCQASAVVQVPRSEPQVFFFLVNTSRLAWTECDQCDHSVSLYLECNPVSPRKLINIYLLTISI